MQTARPRFSVVIPAFNEANYIANTLASLTQQTFTDFEVIVVDNNSTDQTATIAKGLSARVIKEKRPGVCWARQAGTEAANGDIVVSTDADTTFSPQWLENINNMFVKRPHLVGVAGPCHYVDGPLWGEVYPYILFGYVSLINKLTRKTIYISATNIAFKKEVWEGYNTLLTQGGDELDLLHKLQKKGKVIFLNGNPTYTSARRLARGLFYNVIVSFFIYYILEYNLTRLFKRPILGSAPKFRNEFSPAVLTLFHFAIGVLLLAAFSLYTQPGHYLVREAHRLIRDTNHIIMRARR